MDQHPKSNHTGYDPVATAATRRHYERNSRFYDLMQRGSAVRHDPWRELIWSQVKGPKVLEVGVGTGRNIPYYPDDIDITAIELTSGMLARAQQQATNLHKLVDLRAGDIQQLDFRDATFDTVIATFVFCSVTNPVLGFQEIIRVLKPSGVVLLLDHVRSEHPFWGKLMDMFNPLMLTLAGDNINRCTVENVRRSGLAIDEVIDLGRAGIFKMIVAHRPEVNSGD